MMTKNFVANPNNSTSLVVRGWNRAELDKTLADFRNAYDLPATSDWAISAKSDSVFDITFPTDIRLMLLYFLVNYLTYPKDFDLTHRKIGVVGRVTLSLAFGIPDQSLVGQHAEIYVPADDKDYDLVYVHTAAGAAYEVSFTDLVWHQKPTARVPTAIAGL